MAEVELGETLRAAWRPTVLVMTEGLGVRESEGPGKPVSSTSSILGSDPLAGLLRESVGVVPECWEQGVPLEQGVQGVQGVPLEHWDPGVVPIDPDAVPLEPGVVQIPGRGSDLWLLGPDP